MFKSTVPRGLHSGVVVGTSILQRCCCGAVSRELYSNILLSLRNVTFHH